MSTVAPVPVVLDPATHRYSAGLVSYTSVSEVIRSVMATDYSGISPEVLENARLRGVFIDTTFCAWLRGEPTVIKAGTPTDWRDRLLMLINWWDRQKWYSHPSTQIILQDDENLIAGTCDFSFPCDLNFMRHIVDLKVVSSLQPSYALQLGAYAEMADAENVGIIHVTKDRVRLVEYDAAQCREDWRSAVDWWKRKTRLDPRTGRAIGG